MIVSQRILALFICVLLIVGTIPHSAHGEEVCAGEERIVAIEVTGSSVTDEQLIRDVLPCKEGDVYDPALVARAQKHLIKWGPFRKIEERVTRRDGGVVVSYTLEDTVVVAAVDITGNYPYIENKVRKYLTLNVGDAYSAEKVQEQVDRIQEFYAREGYVDTVVTVNEEEAATENNVILTFQIHKGRLLRYAAIDIEGNTAWPKGRFVSAINTYEPYSEKRLRNSIKALTALYHAHGYPRAKIRITRKDINLETNRVYLALAIDEGTYIDARFRGNKRLSDAQLRKIITIFKEGSYDSFEIEESVKALTAHYRVRGYPEAAVEAIKTKVNEDYYIITFDINEGPSRYIKQIEFEGNEHVDADDLEKDMKTLQHAIGRSGALMEGHIEEDRETILKNFAKEGYLDARVDDWQVAPTEQGFAYDITIPVEEGAQTIVGSVTFDGRDTAPEKDILETLKLKKGAPYNPLILPDEKQRVTMYYADHGHPYVEVAQDVTVDPATHTAAIAYTIDEGPEVRIGEILIVGDVLTSQNAIKKAMELKPGDLFSYQKLIDSQLNIRRLGAFTSVRIETLGIEERQTTVHLKVSVNEERPFSLNIEAAYATDESFTGTLAFTNLNSFGWAKRTFLRLTGGKKLSRAELGWVDPRFLSSPFEMSTIAWIQHRVRPTFNYVQLGGTMGFFRRFSRIGLYFREDVTRNYFVEGDSVAADAESLRNNTISRTAVSASYDTRDNYADPTRGFYSLGELDFYNEIKGNNAHFMKLRLALEYDIPFWRRLIFSSAGRFDHITTYGQTVSVPTNELLYMGGDDTVRGFSEDSLGPTNAAGQATGGRLRFIINEELRFRVFKNFHVAGFLDVGSLTDTFSQIDLDSVRESAGMGLRYMTPVGPIRLDYGFVLDRQAGESVGRLHFTFGYVF